MRAMLTMAASCLHNSASIHVRKMSLITKTTYPYLLRKMWYSLAKFAKCVSDIFFFFFFWRLKLNNVIVNCKSFWNTKIWTCLACCFCFYTKSRQNKCNKYQTNNLSTNQMRVCHQGREISQNSLLREANGLHRNLALLRGSAVSCFWKAISCHEYIN